MYLAVWSFLLFCITPKLLYIFLLPDCFSCVRVCNTVQLLLNQENISSSENSDVLVEAQLDFSVWLKGVGGCWLWDQDFMN